MQRFEETVKERVVYRTEVKYPVSCFEMARIKTRLEKIMLWDENSGGRSYRVRSLYFDSPYNTDYHEKLAGVNHRKKIRLRIYNNDMSVCKLEKKEKFGENQSKQSVMIDIDDARELTEGNIDVLQKYVADSRSAEDIYLIMRSGIYRPAVLVDYDRYAFYHPQYDTRITIDFNIRKKEGSVSLQTEPASLVPVDCGNAVLEIKYTGKSLDFISELLKGCGIEQNAYSKYCASRMLLN